MDCSIIIGLNPKGNIVASSCSRNPAKSSADLITGLFGKYGKGIWSAGGATYPLKAKLEVLSRNAAPFMKGFDVEEEYKIKISTIKKVFKKYIESKSKKCKQKSKHFCQRAIRKK